MTHRLIYDTQNDTQTHLWHTDSVIIMMHNTHMITTHDFLQPHISPHNIYTHNISTHSLTICHSRRSKRQQRQAFQEKNGQDSWGWLERDISLSSPFFVLQGGGGCAVVHGVLHLRCSHPNHPSGHTYRRPQSEVILLPNHNTPYPTAPYHTLTILYHIIPYYIISYYITPSCTTPSPNTRYSYSS